MRGRGTRFSPPKAKGYVRVHQKPLLPADLEDQIQKINGKLKKRQTTVEQLNITLTELHTQFSHLSLPSSTDEKNPAEQLFQEPSRTKVKLRQQANDFEGKWTRLRQVIAAEASQEKATRATLQKQLEGILLKQRTSIKMLQTIKASLAKVIEPSITALEKKLNDDELRQEFATCFGWFSSKPTALVSKTQQVLRDKFASLSLYETQIFITEILSGGNRTKKIKTMYDFVQLKAELRRLTPKDHATRNAFYEIDDNSFRWTPLAFQLEITLEGAVKEAQQFNGALDAMAPVADHQVSLQELTQDLEDLGKLDKQFKEEVEEEEKSEREARDFHAGCNKTILTELTQFKKSQIQALNVVNDTWPNANLSACSQVEVELGRSVFAGINCLGKHLEKLNIDETELAQDVRGKTKKLYERKMKLHVEAVQLSYQLLEYAQVLKLAYQDDILPEVYEHALNEAIQAQAALVTRLTTAEASDDSAELAAQLKQKLAMLPVNYVINNINTIRASQFCRLLKKVICDSSYWNQQLLFSSLRKEALPTGIKTMKAIVDRYERDYGGTWTESPDYAPQFLDAIKTAAQERLNNKTCCFFNSGRTVRTAQFYKFLSKLDSSHIKSDDLLTAKKVDAIAHTLAAVAPVIEEERKQRQNRNIL